MNIVKAVQWIESYPGITIYIGSNSITITNSHSVEVTDKCLVSVVEKFIDVESRIQKSNRGC